MVVKKLIKKHLNDKAKILGVEKLHWVSAFTRSDPEEKHIVSETYIDGVRLRNLTLEE